MKTLKEIFKEHGIVPGDFVYDTIERVVESYSAELRNELLNERKLNEEIKARFVKCNTCTDEMKSKCLMFSENLCSGERCEELVDLMGLVSKSDNETKIAEAKEIIRELIESMQPIKFEEDRQIAIAKAEAFLKEC